MNDYEAVFILDERRIEDGGEAFSSEVESQVTQLGGSVQKKESMGRKHFARMIGKHKAGIYWDFVLSLDPATIDDLRDKYRLDRRVIRLAVLNYEPPPPDYERAPPLPASARDRHRD